MSKRVGGDGGGGAPKKPICRDFFCVASARESELRDHDSAGTISRDLKCNRLLTYPLHKVLPSSLDPATQSVCVESCTRIISCAALRS